MKARDRGYGVDNATTEHNWANPAGQTMDILVILMLSGLLFCCVASVVYLVRREWALAIFFAAPVMLVVVAVTVEHFRAQAIREARQQAIERGDIPPEPNVGE